MHPVRCSCATRRLVSPCRGLLLVLDSLSRATREESVEEHPWGSSTPKASLGKRGENGSCVVEKSRLLRLISLGNGIFQREGLGWWLRLEKAVFSDLSCPYRTVVERLGGEILLFKGRVERVEFPQVGLGLCLWPWSVWDGGGGAWLWERAAPPSLGARQGKKLVKTTQDHPSLPCVANQLEAKRCVGVTAYLIMGRLRFLPYSSYYFMFSIMMCLLWASKTHHSFTYIKLVLHFNWIDMCVCESK